MKYFFPKIREEKLFKLAPEFFSFLILSNCQSCNDTRLSETHLLNFRPFHGLLSRSDPRFNARDGDLFAQRRIVIGFIHTRGTRSARCVYAGGPFRTGDATAVCAKNGGGGSQVQGHRRLPPPLRPRPPSPPPPPTHPLTYHRNIYTHIGASEPRQERIKP